MTEHSAGASPVNKFVKLVIQPGKLRRAAPAGIKVHKVHLFRKGIKLFLRSALGCPICRKTFQHLANNVNIVNVVFGYRLHHHAPVGHGKHKSLQLKLLKRFSYGRTAHLQLLCEAGLHKIISVLVAAVQYTVSNMVIYL